MPLLTFGRALTKMPLKIINCIAYHFICSKVDKPGKNDKITATKEIELI